MYLKEIVIEGFKSFADRTKVELERGVTTIVGPNGCGKSNVLDAIRWVLGEQSAKALRGGKMHDVIFAGTDQRQPYNECQVSLLFSDCEKDLGTSFNEVEITRKVTREGSSNYYLNGKACRLKDIQELFMDTGIGRVSYSFMVQGQIDQILSNNPEERRIIFEEAAGITRFKTQRREALNKLAQVDQNLSRVNDVIEEVNRQMGSLKRQASKAIRFKKIKHRLTHLDLAFNGRYFNERKEKVKGLEQKEGGLRDVVSNIESSVKEEEETIQEKKQERSQFYDFLQEVQQRVYDYRSEKDQARNQSELAVVRKKDSEERINEIEAEIKSLVTQIENLTNKAHGDSEVKQSQLDEVASSDSVFKEKNEELEALQKQLNEAEQRLQSKKNELIKSEGHIHRLRSACNDFEVTRQTNNAKLTDLHERRVQLEEAKDKLKEALDSTQTEVRDQEVCCDKVAEALEEASKIVNERIASFKETQKEIQENDRLLARLNAQLNILTSLQSKLEGFSGGVKAILQGKLKDILPEGSYKLLTKDLELDDNFTLAFETLLGHAADAIALDDIDQVIPVANRLAEEEMGRACLQIQLTEECDVHNVEQTVPEFMIPAIKAIKVQDKSLKNRWEKLLSNCYIADSLSEFLAFWREQPKWHFHFVATKDGAFLDSRGLIYGGGVTKENKSASFMHREAEIRQLKDSIELEQTKLDELHKQSGRKQEALDEAEQKIEHKRQDLTEQKHSLSELKLSLREAENALRNNEQEHTKVIQGLESLKTSHTDSEEQLEQSRNELNEATEKLDALKSEISKGEESIASIREKRDEKREELSDVKIDLAEKRQRLDILDQGLVEIENQRKELFRKQEQKSQEITRLQDLIAHLQSEAEESSIRADELEKSLAQATAQLDEERKKLMAVEEVITNTEAKLSDKRKKLHDEERSLKDCEVELTKERSELNFLIEKAKTEYHVELENVDWKQELWKADEEFETRIKLDELDDADELVPKPKHDRGEPSVEDLDAMDETDWSAIKEEIDSLRKRISSMGEVNLVAIDEYLELKERYEFLNKQCEDLTGSKEQLLTAIDQINETSQNLFRETFEKIKQNFTYTFDALFGGGYADLTLIEGEDVLESGIDITARPPGTKLKSLSLLSGGQKTMTAVALLFAIYKVKPSPFCVLDELDAPLDDANIGRFTSMLREFTRYSQFLVISHNKRTISASDSIYGVTMQERGVTRLLSMRFDRKNDKVESSTGNEEDVLAEPSLA